MLSKRNVSVGMCIALFALLSLLACRLVTNAADDDTPKLKRMKMTSESSKPAERFEIASDLKFPKEVMVYRVKRKPVTYEMVRSLAIKLGMREPEESGTRQPGEKKPRRRINVSPDGSKAVYCDGETGQMLYHVGSDGIIWYDGDTGRMEDGEAPSETEAQAIARDFIDSADLLPKGAKLVPGPVAASTWSRSDGANYSSVVVHRLVLFWVVQKDSPVGGSYIEMRIGHGGKIHQLTRCAREVEPFKAYPAKNIEEVMADLESLNARVTIEKRAKSAKIKSMKLSYWEPIHFERAEHIQPAYVLTGDAEVITGGEVIPFTARVAAVKDEFTAPQEQDSKKAD